MPNWISNIVTGPREALESIVGPDYEPGKPSIDFGKVLPWGGELLPGDGVYCAAEDVAKAYIAARTDMPLEETTAYRALRCGHEQVAIMLRNYRSTGYLHSMDFARARWGTKWGAFQPEVVLDSTPAKLQFDTAWACPLPVLLEMSRLYPDADINVIFADEDIGFNCGTLRLRGGAVVFEDIAPRADRHEDKAMRARWQHFAREVKGWPADESDD